MQREYVRRGRRWHHVRREREGDVGRTFRDKHGEKQMRQAKALWSVAVVALLASKSQSGLQV